MIRIGDQVFRDHGVAPTWFVKLFARDPGAARRLRHLRRQTADGRHCLHRQHRRPGGADQGYGKDDAVNGMIAAFWSLAAHHRDGSSSLRVSRRKPTSPTPSLATTSAECWRKAGHGSGHPPDLRDGGGGHGVRHRRRGGRVAQHGTGLSLLSRCGVESRCTAGAECAPAPAVRSSLFRHRTA